MDRNELLGGGSQKADFSGAICDQIIGHTGYYQWFINTNERYGHYLSTDNPKFTVQIQALKVKHFFKISKTLEIDHFLLSSEAPFFGPFFFKIACHFEVWIEIFEWNQSQVKPKVQNFQNIKKAYWYL